MRLVMQTYQLGDKCKICQKLETKWRRILKEQERIKRWKKEGGRGASISASEEIIDDCSAEMNELEMHKQENKRSLKA